MTHKDIKTKFMIEYDKADVTSSYPQLTEYEIATILDKAYLVLIAQKFTGNNTRKVPVEGDVKLIEDLRPLAKTELIRGNFGDNEQLTSADSVGNIIKYTIPEDFLYYVSSLLYYNVQATQDLIYMKKIPVRLVDHNTATKFMATPYNMPWIKNPVAYCEGESMYVLYDPFTEPYSNTIQGNIEKAVPMSITYIKQPDKFVKNNIEDLFDEESIFECSDTMAEQLVSLAITYALENIESPRLNTNLNIKGLES